MIKSKSYDIVFCTHALENTGFGHAARCAKLAYLIKNKNPKLTVSFCGDFTNNSKILIKKICKFDVCFSKDSFSNVMFYDRMDNHLDPNFISYKNVNYFKNRCNKMILMVNGRNMPIVEKDIIYVGYKISENLTEQSNIFWSLKYSPVFFPNEKKQIIKENKHQVLVSFGGGFIDSDLDRVISALIQLDEVNIIKILLSPLNKNYNFNKNSNNKNLLYIRNIDDVKNIIEQSSLIICSYGHFTYEAMSLGKVLCVFGKKNFQNQYANILDKNELCVNCGLIDQFSQNKFLNDLSRAFENKNKLKFNTKNYITKNGLENITNLIIDQIKK